jgi:hypothetical protein
MRGSSNATHFLSSNFETAIVYWKCLLDVETAVTFFRAESFASEFG